MIIKNYKPIHKGVVVCSFTLVCDKWANFEIRNCTLFDSNGKRWISLPSKEYEADGKKKYFPLVGFAEREVNDRFLATIMATVDQYIATLPKETLQPARGAAQMSFADLDDELPF